MVKKDYFFTVIAFILALMVSSCTTLTPVQKQDEAVLNQHLWIEKSLGIGKNFYFLNNNFYNSSQFFGYVIYENGYGQIYNDGKYLFYGGDYTQLINYSTYQETPDSLVVTYHLKSGIIFKIEMPLENFVYMSYIYCNLGDIMAANRWTVVPLGTICFGFKNCEAAKAATGMAGPHYMPATDWGRVSDALKNCREQHDPHKNQWYLNFKKYIVSGYKSNQHVQNFALNMIADGYAGTVTIIKAPENAVKEIQANTLKIKEIIMPMSFTDLYAGAYNLILTPANKLLLSIMSYEIHYDQVPN